MDDGDTTPVTPDQEPDTLTDEDEGKKHLDLIFANLPQFIVKTQNVHYQHTFAFDGMLLTIEEWHMTRATGQHVSLSRGEMEHIIRVWNAIVSADGEDEHIW